MANSGNFIKPDRSQEEPAMSIQNSIISVCCLVDEMLKSVVKQKLRDRGLAQRSLGTICFLINKQNGNPPLQFELLVPV